MPEALRGFDKESRQLIGVMTEIGWSGRVTSKGHYLAKAPDGKTTITVPSKMSVANRTAANTRAQFAKWLRDNGPAEIFVALDGCDKDDDLSRDVLIGAAAKGLARQMGKPHGAVSVVSEPSVRAVEREESVTTEGVSAERCVVARYWTDGSVDFRCDAVGCDYVNSKAKGVAMHYGRVHAKTLGRRPGSPWKRPVSVPAPAGEQESSVEAESLPVQDAVAVLAQIQALVSAPLVAELSKRAEKAEQERDALAQRLTQMQQDLDALRQIIDSIGK